MRVQQQLTAYDEAFAAFFTDLEAHGIDRSNTLFVITVDEGDHFAGGTGHAAGPTGRSPTRTRTAPNRWTACPANQIGEVNANLADAAGRDAPSSQCTSDDAPTSTLNGHPSGTEPGGAEASSAIGRSCKLSDPYVDEGAPSPIAAQHRRLGGGGDPAHGQHRPGRTPTFTLFGNPDVLLHGGTGELERRSSGRNPCVDARFRVEPRRHPGGDRERHGRHRRPGVAAGGVDSKTWTDHTNLRPTMLALPA